jgi:hypothetical protein
MFFYHAAPVSTLDHAVALRAEYERLRDLLWRLCPAGEKRRQAEAALHTSLLCALLGIRLHTY